MVQAELTHASETMMHLMSHAIPAPTNHPVIIKEPIKSSEVVAEEMCGICFDDFTNPVATMPCRHRFCQNCIQSWLSSARGKHLCSTCRQPVTHLSPIVQDDTYVATTASASNESKTHATSHATSLPAVPTTKSSSTNNKVTFVLDYLTRIAKDEAVIVFAHDNQLLKDLQSQLPSDMNYVVVTAETHAHQKTRKKIEAFQTTSDQLRLVLASFNTCRHGWNFQRANHIIFLEPPRATDEMAQAVGRLTRIGQERKIFVTACLYKNTFDTVLWDKIAPSLESNEHSSSRRNARTGINIKLCYFHVGRA
jgi:SNF2 family DNA or RNA helicase